jgi:hypothetical protein
LPNLWYNILKVKHFEIKNNNKLIYTTSLPPSKAEALSPKKREQKGINF